MSLDAKAMSFPRLRGFAFVGLLFCAGVILWSSAWQLSETKTSTVRQQMAGWYRAGDVSTSDSWRRAKRELETAIRLNPYSPRAHLDLGHLYEWRAVAAHSTSSSSQEQRRWATGHYRRALQLRPSWGLAWSSLATNAALSGERSDDVRVAVERALELEPWSSEIQRRGILAAMLVWDQLPTSTKAKVFGAARRLSVQSSSDHLMKNMAARYGMGKRWEEVKARSSDSGGS